MGNNKANMEIRKKLMAEVSAIRSERYAGDRPLIDVAIEREHWELAAYCMLVGVVEGLNKPPHDAVEAFLDELAAEMPEHRGSRARSRKRPHGPHR